MCASGWSRDDLAGEVAPPPLVLVVEDEAHIAEALTFVIEEAGFAVRTAANGREALALAAEHPPALVISDLMMPVIDGEQLLRELRARGVTAPVVLMSAAGRRHVEALGADATLEKPFELAEVEALLRRFLGASP